MISESSCTTISTNNSALQELHDAATENEPSANLGPPSEKHNAEMDTAGKTTEKLVNAQETTADSSQTQPLVGDAIMIQDNIESLLTRMATSSTSSLHELESLQECAAAFQMQTKMLSRSTGIFNAVGRLMSQIKKACTPKPTKQQRTEQQPKHYSHFEIERTTKTNSTLPTSQEPATEQSTHATHTQPPHSDNRLANDTLVAEMIDCERQITEGNSVTQLLQWASDGDKTEEGDQEQLQVWVQKTVLKKFGFVAHEHALQEYTTAKHRVARKGSE